LVDKNCDGMNHNEWRHVDRKSQWFVRPNVWWFFFFLLSTRSTLLRGNVSAILLLWCCNFLPWMSKVLTQDQALCEFTSISFWQFVYGHIQFFPCVLCLWTRFTRIFFFHR
jgi:hypothetical protein